MKELPIPSFFNPKGVGDLRMVNYPKITVEARRYAQQHSIAKAVKDTVRIGAIGIDVQGTFTHPEGGLPVIGALEATVRTCQWGYKNLRRITQWLTTMDTHTVAQIFHELFLINDKGEHPGPATMISNDEIKRGVWRVNPAIAAILMPGVSGAYTYLQEYLEYYTAKLAETRPGRPDKYLLTMWPYHAMIGGMEHALVPLFHEMIFFHEIAREAQRLPVFKGGNPFTENYSPIQPEVLMDHKNVSIAQKNTTFIKALLDFDKIVAFGFASSHCFAWFIDDLLNEIRTKDASLVKKVYLMKDCTAPVVIPGVVDFTPQAEAAFKRFSDAGMHVVDSTTPMDSWPDMI